MNREIEDSDEHTDGAFSSDTDEFAPNVHSVSDVEAELVQENQIALDVVAPLYVPD